MEPRRVLKSVMPPWVIRIALRPGRKMFGEEIRTFLQDSLP
jgi:hypothetical protein